VRAAAIGGDVVHHTQAHPHGICVPSGDICWRNIHGGSWWRQSLGVCYCIRNPTLLVLHHLPTSAMGFVLGKRHLLVCLDTRHLSKLGVLYELLSIKARPPGGAASFIKVLRQIARAIALSRRRRGGCRGRGLRARGIGLHRAAGGPSRP